MLARLRTAIDDQEQGFTLIELLVVMIIIGILAAIAIPLFLNQKKKAHETAAKSDASNIAKEVAAFEVDGNPFDIKPAVAMPVAGPTSVEIDAYSDAATVSDKTTVKLGNGDNLTNLKYDSATGDYCVEVTPSDTNAKPWYANQDGLFKGTCP